MDLLSTLMRRLNLSATDAAIVVCVVVAAANALVAFWEWLRSVG
jgi:hypothetical protein